MGWAGAGCEPLVTSSHYIANIVGGSLVSVASYIGTTLESVPAWLREFGLPVVLLAGAIWVIIMLFRLNVRMASEHARAMKAESDARISDRDTFIRTLREDAAKGEESRKELLIATNKQTGVVEKQTSVVEELVREMRRAGFHRPNE